MLFSDNDINLPCFAQHCHTYFILAYSFVWLYHYTNLSSGLSKYPKSFQYRYQPKIKCSLTECSHQQLHSSFFGHYLEASSFLNSLLYFRDNICCPPSVTINRFGSLFTYILLSCPSQRENPSLHRYCSHHLTHKSSHDLTAPGGAANKITGIFGYFHKGISKHFNITKAIKQTNPEKKKKKTTLPTKELVTRTTDITPTSSFPILNCQLS